MSNPRLPKLGCSPGESWRTDRKVITFLHPRTKELLRLEISRLTELTFQFPPRHCLTKWEFNLYTHVPAPTHQRPLAVFQWIASERTLLENMFDPDPERYERFDPGVRTDVYNGTILQRLWDQPDNANMLALLVDTVWQASEPTEKEME